MKLLGERNWKLALAVAVAIATAGWEKTANAQLMPPKPEEAAPPTEVAPVSAEGRTRLLHSFKGHETAVDSLVFSPNGEVLVSGGSYNDPTIIFWSIKEGEEVEQIRAQRTAVLTLALSPNGNTLVSSGSDGGINIWDWKTGEYLATFLQDFSNILSLAITPDSRTLVSGGLNGIRVWDLVPQRPIYTLASIGYPTYALAINPNGYILASGDNVGRVRYWNLRTGTSVDEFFPHSLSIRGLAYSADGNTLITSSDDRTVKVWNASTGQLLHTFTGHTGPVRAIALSPDNQTLASASNDGVRLWNIRTGEQLDWLDSGSDWVESVAFSPDGRLLASGAFNRTINIWQLPGSGSSNTRVSQF